MDGLERVLETVALEIIAEAGFEDYESVLIRAGYDSGQVRHIEDEGMLMYYALHLVSVDGVREDDFVNDAFLEGEDDW